MRWAEIKKVVDKWIVIKQFANGTAKYGVFKVKPFKDFPVIYKVTISPAKPFRETFGDNDMYSMDLAGMLDINVNVFDTYQMANKYYHSIIE